MGAYATAAQVTSALAAYPDLTPPSGELLDHLIALGESAVDRRLGPYVGDPLTGRKLDATLLNAGQRAALVRAVAVAVGHLSQLDGEQALGVDDVLPASLAPQRGAGLAVRIDEQLAGHGLVARSGCAAPDPVPVGAGPLLPR